MTIRKTVNLVMRSCNNNPYGPKPTHREQVLWAIDLSNLFLEFANKGMYDEAMNLDSNHWEQVISKLKEKL